MSDISDVGDDDGLEGGADTLEAVETAQANPESRGHPDLGRGEDVQTVYEAMRGIDPDSADNLMDEWRGEETVNILYAKRAAIHVLDQFPGDEQQAILERVGDDPVIIDYLARMGRRLAHDAREERDMPNPSDDNLMDLMHQQVAALNRGEKHIVRRLQDRIDAITRLEAEDDEYDEDRPIVGSGGRTF